MKAKMVGFVFIPILAVCYYTFLGFFVDEDYYFAVLGCLCLLALSPAIVLKSDIDVFEPIVLVYLATFLGGAARSILIANNGWENYPFIMQGYNLDVLYPNGFFILIGLFSFSIGYLYTSKGVFLGYGRFAYEIDHVKLKYVSLLFLFVSILGTYLYSQVNQIDFSDIENISNKRASVVGDGETYTAHGYLKLVADFSKYALYYVLAYILWGRGGYFFSGMAVILFFSACVTPFISSSRIDIILLMVNLSIMVYYRNGRNVPKKMLALFVILSFLLAAGMGFLRAVAQGKDVEQINSPVESVIGSGNFVDIMRFAVIVEEVPEKLDYLYGESLFTWVTAAIPRSVWPEKPQISLGPLVRSEIYDLPTRNNGFPPGIVAEGYMNFGIFGVFFIPLLFGILLRFIYNSFSSYLSLYPVVCIVYVGFIWRFSFGAIGLNFSQALVQVLTDLAVLVLMMFMVLKRPS